MGINFAFNENLHTWESIDTDGRDGNCLYMFGYSARRKY
jgi:hypothetical protein